MSILDVAIEREPMLRGYFAKRGAAPDIIDDLVQDTYLSILRAAPTQAVPNEPRSVAYVVRAARSALWMNYRRERRQVSAVPLDSVLDRAGCEDVETAVIIRDTLRGALANPRYAGAIRRKVRGENTLTDNVRIYRLRQLFSKGV